jgi:hypothetical protein
MKQFVAVCLIFGMLAPAASAQQITPEAAARIRALIDELAAVPKPPEKVIVVPAGSNLQAALDAANEGDILELEAGATFVGNFTVGTRFDYVTVRGKATIHSPNHQAAVATRAAASYWRFTGGLTFTQTLPDGPVVRLGTGSHTEAAIPHHFIFDGVNVLAHPALGGKRGIEANANHVEIRNSKILGFWRNGQDSQAVLIWNAHGPLLVDNNDLEASGENFMSGGADPSIVGLVPSDITFTNNRVSKPLSWKATATTPAKGTVKNLFELKAARRVYIAGNLFENNWLHGQTGWAILLKSVNQDGNCNWCVTSDVIFENNIVRNTSSGINLAGRPEASEAIGMSNIVVRNNLIQTNRAEMSGQGWCFMVQGVVDLTIEYNTCEQDGPVALFMGERVSPRMIIRRNILVDPAAGSAWGIKGDSTAEGMATFTRWAPDVTFVENLIVTPTPSLYGPPTQNRLELTMPADTTGYGTTLARP